MRLYKCFLHLQQAHYLLHFRPSLDEVEADGRFHVEGVWWGLDRMSRMHVRILFLQFFCVQLFGPGILCHRCWAFGIRVGRGCLSRLRLMHPDTLHCRKCCWQMPGLLLCYKTWRGIWRHASNIQYSSNHFSSCRRYQSQVLPFLSFASRHPSACVFYKPNPPCSSGAHGEHWPVDSEEFAEKKRLAWQRYCVAGHLHRKGKHLMWVCVRVYTTSVRSIKNVAVFPSDSCGPGHIRKWWLTLRPEMGRKFPLVAGFLHCGSFSQVGWNDGVLVVSETQFLSAWTQDARCRPKKSVYPDCQDRSLLYMCVDIQYEWDGFASCRRPIHKWLLLSYGLVVMSRLVHVAGALMPFSCK